MSIIYRSFGSAMGLPDMSPFGIKLDCYLRMTKLPFTKKKGDSRKSPKGKLPIIEHDGKVIADTSHIIRYLEATFDVDLDTELTDEQKAVSTALKSMVEEHLYFIFVYFRWVDEEAWEGTYKKVIGQTIKDVGVPALLLPFILKSVRKKLTKSLHAQGVGRHSRDELIAVGKEHLQAISVLLGDKEYIHGDQPSNIDASVFGMLSGLIIPDVDSSLRQYAQSLGNLEPYIKRIQERYYQE